MRLVPPTGPSAGGPAGIRVGALVTLGGVVLVEMPGEMLAGGGFAAGMLVFVTVVGAEEVDGLVVAESGAASPAFGGGFR